MKAIHVGIAVALGCLMSSSGHAATLRVTPQHAVIIPGTVEGATRVLFSFDLAGLRQGDNRKIEDATIDWKTAGIPSDAVSSYALFPVTTSWTVEGAGEGNAPSFAGEAAGLWELEPNELLRTETPRVRFDVTQLVSDWAAGGANYGVMVSTSSLDPNTLGTQLAKATLTVRYGFRRTPGQ